MNMASGSKLPGTNKLDVKLHLDCAASGVTVLRELTAKDETMRSGEFGRAVGLIGEEGWRPWHRQQLANVLRLIAAVDVHNNGAETLDFHRIVGADGKPGTGVSHNSRLNF
jgi:hypothetical protein